MPKLASRAVSKAKNSPPIRREPNETAGLVPESSPSKTGLLPPEGSPYPGHRLSAQMKYVLWRSGPPLPPSLLVLGKHLRNGPISRGSSTTGVIGRSRDESRELHRAFKNTRSQRLASSPTAPAHRCRTICHGDICARCATGEHPKGDLPPRPHISRGTPSFRHPISNARMPAGTPEYGCTYAAAAGLSRSRSTPPPAKARIVRLYGTCASVEWYASENSGWRTSQWTRLTR
jgi:hypothetical protein